ncbi:hypothetical protein JXA12_03915 [Candidatus Woesearchaeota archaeon]|nr:hypothetical protein [Candidatus Woesearchaeota archaeon]
MNLREWTKIFLTQRDLLKQELRSLEETDDGFVMHKKDSTTTKASVRETLGEPSDGIIVCPNTRKNVEALAREWQGFSSRQELLIVFANPDTNEKWLIKPHHHGRIADEESLEQGLLAMHEAITAV